MIYYFRKNSEKTRCLENVTIIVIRTSKEKLRDCFLHPGVLTLRKNESRVLGENKSVAY